MIFNFSYIFFYTLLIPNKSEESEKKLCNNLRYSTIIHLKKI
jgi:hypothetical protein